MCDESLVESPKAFIQMEYPLCDVPSAEVQTMHYGDNGGLPLDTGESHITSSYHMA